MKNKEKKHAVTEDVVKPSWMCRSCGHDSYDVFSDLPTTYYAGTLDDGTRYTHVSRKRVRCGNCCQMSVVMSHDFDPALWN